MYPTKTQWKPYDENTTYPIEEHYPDVELILKKINSRIVIPVCTKCKTNKQTIPCPHLHPIPQQIQSVPMMQRRFLSPIFLHCSLGRNTGGNPFSEYRILMKFSKNMRALKLYSGTMGAFLPAENHNNDYVWCTEELQIAADWLKNNNCYIRPYTELLTINNSVPHSSRPFPHAEHSNTNTTVPPIHENR